MKMARGVPGGVCRVLEGSGSGSGSAAAQCLNNAFSAPLDGEVEWF